MSQDGSEIIPTRMSKVSAPKPASNPLQFIKVGPCDLYKAAQEQIKKVEEIKKVEKVKDDSEDWQSVRETQVIYSFQSLNEEDESDGYLKSYCRIWTTGSVADGSAKSI